MAAYRCLQVHPHSRRRYRSVPSVGNDPEDSGNAGPLEDLLIATGTVIAPN